MQDLHIVQQVFLMFTIVCRISKCPKIQQDKNLSNFDKLRSQNNRNLKIYDFLQKLKKVARIVLYGPAISQSDCRKAGPYQLPYNNALYCIVFHCIALHWRQRLYLRFTYSIKLFYHGTLVLPCLCKRVLKVQVMTYAVLSKLTIFYHCR